MHSLNLYNTLSREIEPVVAADGKCLRFYCCGPTVYGRAHIGNFRTFVLQDLFRRVVEATGLKTLHVRNITDVDDKTIKGAIEAKESLKDFTKKWQDIFEADCLKLGMLNPHESPSAVEHISEQISLIKKLIDKGLAYKTDTNCVYFRISQFKDYGKLSGVNLEATKPNADQRLSLNDEYDKENISDFALWKAYRDEDGDNAWDSPWGKGRPGWHLECSAMCMKYLGDTLDLHSGGVDLTFPHHENEIAQSQGASGKPFARHWFHIAHLKVEGQKMSKSLGNLYTLDDIEDWGYEANDLRYLLLSGHYRQTFNFTKDGLGACASARKRLSSFLEMLPAGESSSVKDFGIFQPVMDALCDDLNTSKALGALHTIVRDKSSEIKSGNLKGSELADVASCFRAILDIFGITKCKEKAVEIPQAIKDLADARLVARKNKDWSEADRLRDALKDAGWEMRDSSEGYKLVPV